MSESQLADLIIAAILLVAVSGTNGAWVLKNVRHGDPVWLAAGSLLVALLGAFVAGWVLGSP